MQMPDAETHGHAFAVILQRATQVLFHLDQCGSIRTQAIAQFSAHLQKEPQLPSSLHAWSPLVSGLIVELSGALAAIRVMQNDTWCLIASMCGARDTPSSIRDACAIFLRDSKHGNKRPKWLDAFNAETRNLIVSYWDTSGFQLANYRDVDQHHDVLARGAIFFPEREGQSRLSIQLPDNPEVKARSRFTYTKVVDALEVAKTGFTGLHDLVERIAESRGARPQPIGQGFEFDPSIVHQPGIPALTAIVLYDVEGKSGTVVGQNEKMQVTIRNIVL